MSFRGQPESLEELLDWLAEQIRNLRTGGTVTIDGAPLAFRDEGVNAGTAGVLDVVGALASLTVAGDVATLTVGGSSGVDIEDEGVAQGTATILDFVGAGVTAAVAAGQATITIAGGGGGGSASFASVAKWGTVG